jgi:hypothetical protein
MVVVGGEGETTAKRRRGGIRRVGGERYSILDKIQNTCT